MMRRAWITVVLVFAVSGLAEAQTYYPGPQDFNYSMGPGVSLSVRAVPYYYTADFQIRLYPPYSTYPIAQTYEGPGVTDTLNYTVPSSGASGSWRVSVVRISGPTYGGFTYTATVSPSATTSLPYYSYDMTFYYSMAPGYQVNPRSTPDSYADYNMYLYSPTGALVASSTNYGGGVSDSISYLVPSSGTPGTYQLRVTRAWGSGGFYFANQMTIYMFASPSYTQLSGSLTSHWYSFTLSTGQALQVWVYPDYNADYRISLYGPSGNYILELNSGGEGVAEILNYSATSSGTHQIRVWKPYYSGPGGAFYRSVVGTASTTTSTTSTTTSTTTGTTSTSTETTVLNLSSQRFEWQSGYSRREDGLYSLYTINVTAGRTYTITTSNATGGTTTDTYLYLYLGSSMVAYDDDSNGSLASKITLYASTSGTYTIRLRAYPSGGYGYCTLKVTQK